MINRKVNFLSWAWATCHATMLSRWLQLHFLKTTDRGLFLASQLWSNSGFLGHLNCWKQDHHWVMWYILRMRKSHRLWVTPASQVYREASIYYLSVMEETPLHLSVAVLPRTISHSPLQQDLPALHFTNCMTIHFSPVWNNSTFLPCNCLLKTMRSATFPHSPLWIRTFCFVPPH